MERHEKLAEVYTEIQNNLRQFYNKGNNAAGTRARLALTEIAKLAKEIRLEVKTEKDARKVAKAN